MKIRNGFVSNSSSSSFVIALPKTYKFSDEEMEAIRDYIEEYDDYFYHYEEEAEAAVNTEILDERERIQKMLETGKIPEEDVDPVTDDIKNADIQKGLEFLTTASSFWLDEPNWGVEVPVHYAALAICEVLRDKIRIGSVEGGPDSGYQMINILSDAFKEKEAMKLVKESFINED